MSITAARIAAPFSRVFKSAVGLGFLSLALYEFGVPALGYAVTDAAGTIVAAAGAVAGTVVAIRA